MSASLAPLAVTLPGRMAEPAPDTVCPCCGHVAAKRHPCRFERACSCWYGVPCYGTGAKYRAPRRKP
jgi:hypothetical protein